MKVLGTFIATIRSRPIRLKDVLTRAYLYVLQCYIAHVLCSSKTYVYVFVRVLYNLNTFLFFYLIVSIFYTLIEDITVVVELIIFIIQRSVKKL